MRKTERENESGQEWTREKERGMKCDLCKYDSTGGFVIAMIILRYVILYVCVCMLI